MAQEIKPNSPKYAVILSENPRKNSATLITLALTQFAVIAAIEYSSLSEINKSTFIYLSIITVMDLMCANILNLNSYPNKSKFKDASNILVGVALVGFTTQLVFGLVNLMPEYNEPFYLNQMAFLLPTLFLLGGAVSSLLAHNNATKDTL